jgi:hypothetical protein
VIWIAMYFFFDALTGVDISTLEVLCQIHIPILHSSSPPLTLASATDRSNMIMPPHNTTSARDRTSSLQEKGAVEDRSNGTSSHQPLQNP